MWVIGCIDAYGAITARHANHKQSIMHSGAEARGKRWRWNIWGQEYTATRYGRLDELTDEELAAVTDWLERHGYKKVEAHNDQAHPTADGGTGGAQKDQSK